MKSLLPVLLLILLIFSVPGCSKKVPDVPNEQLAIKLKEAITKANTSCGFMYPFISLHWLTDIITKAEEDKVTKKYMGNYMGRIFLSSYHNQPVFCITMMMGSGGLKAHLYDCKGRNAIIDRNSVPDFDQMALNGILIYSNFP